MLDRESGRYSEFQRPPPGRELVACRHSDTIVKYCHFKSGRTDHVIENEQRLQSGERGENANEAVVLEFFARWRPSFEEMAKAFSATMAPECRWEQRPMLVTRSLKQAQWFLRFSRRVLRLETADVEVLHVASEGEVVLVERIDHLLRRNGTLIASVPVVGVIELRDDQIVNWREYFNAVGLLPQMLINLIRRRPHIR